MEGDIRSCHCTTIDVISIHALTWRATVLILVMAAQAEFLPTPSHGGRPWQCLTRHSLIGIFLPTPSHGGRLLHPHSLHAKLYFYPRPHMEGDEFCVGFGVHRPISTHALTWRATCRALLLLSGGGISTHALTWRATMSITGTALCETDFYPRPHMEGDNRGLPPFYN